MLMLSFQMVKANQKMGGDVGRFASKVDEARRGHRSGSRLISFSSRVLHEKPRPLAAADNERSQRCMGSRHALKQSR